ncbi:MAG: helix-turn-helix transcriptional regulator [Solirubrobacterales bacterium]|nr:helix-turn-helix transcriptional regulator [Solirubrobacterales bacterium]
MATALAVSAQAAMGQGRVEEAVGLAHAALELGRQAGTPASTCEALEVLGREARLRDLAEAERWFEEARLVAERHGLALWRARALHELGTIDLFTTLRRDRLDAARDAAIDAGALAALALVDLHLAAIGLAGFEPEAATAAAERCADLSRRLGLATLPMALVHLASSFAMAGRTEPMDAVAAEALALAPDDPEVLAGIPGRVLALLHIHRADWTLTRQALDDAIGVLREHPGAWFPFWGLWALLCAVDDINGASACAEAESAPGADISVNRSRILMAGAVLAGRSGDPAKANARLGRADEAAAASENAPVWAMVHRLMLAPAALEDGWGEPVAWARQGLPVFEQRGLAELAGRCRAFLRQAGEPVPRRRRGDGELPSELVAVGVTGREADVLRLLAFGLSNKAIGGRLHLSHRTVERHVANLLMKTEANDRRGLAALAEQAGLSSS